jgi:acyl-CoA synthetase (AMP-forming)/AMP-acid ligase II
MYEIETLFSDSSQARDRRLLWDRWLANGLHDRTTLSDAISSAAARDPQNTIVMHSIERPGTIRLDRLYRESEALARALSHKGLGPGDVVAVQLPNWVETLVTYAALSRIGAIFVPIVHIYGPRETNWILEASGARAFFCPDRWGKIDYRQRLAQMKVSRELDVIMVGKELPEGVSSWAELSTTSAEGAPFPLPCADDPMLIVYTSGTTSEPKGVIHTHRSLLAELRHMPHLPMGGSHVVSLQPWPAGHIGGLCAILGPIVTGCHCILMDRWDANDAATLVEKHRVTVLCGTPFHVSAMLDLKEAGDPRLESVAEVMCGGAGVPPELIERCDASGWLAMRAYGSTEHPTASAGTREMTLSSRVRSDGTACASTEIRIVREDGSDAGAGEPGEVWLRGPEQFLGYTNPELNRDAFAPDGWFRTGDVGILAVDGGLTITDRIKDVIIRGGENLSSLEIEDLVQRHDAVAEAAAIGMSDDRYGERVCIFILPVRGGRAPGVEELVAFFQGLGVAKQKTPERVIEVDELPRTPAGKVKKDILRQRLAELDGRT